MFFQRRVGLSGGSLQPAPVADAIRTAIWVVLAALLWWSWRREERSAGRGQRPGRPVVGPFQEA